MDPERADWLRRIVEEAADRHILPRFLPFGAEGVCEKSGPWDLVTEADLACEAALTQTINTEWPEALVIGEEAVSENPGLMKQIGGAEICVIIDPVDGTWNFANGLATWGVIVAVTRFGVPVWGGLYDALSRSWVTAASGTGTTGVSNAGSVPLTTGSAGAELSGHVPIFLFPDPLRDKIIAALPQFRRINSLRCSCQEYRLLAQGRADFVLAAKLNPWDHAAGVLCVNEAGGVAKLLDGSPYSAANAAGILLSARDARTWDKVARVFEFLL